MFKTQVRVRLCHSRLLGPVSQTVYRYVTFGWEIEVDYPVTAFYSGWYECSTGPLRAVSRMRWDPTALVMEWVT